MLVKGQNLSPKARKEVLSAYIYRLTTENGYPARNPCGARVPAISDEQWLAEHAFYVTKDGRKLLQHHHAEPAYMADQS